MSERERRLRQAALTRATQQPPGPGDDEEAANDSAGARAHRVEHQAKWVDHQVRHAMQRGDFDDLPGAGKPIRGLGGTHDPDWWVKGLIEREQLSGVAPPAIGLRKEAAELEQRLDRETTEHGVRYVIDDFNQRVVEARRQLMGGPPVVTATRDPDLEVAAWRSRRAARREQARARRELEQRTQPAPAPQRSRRTWWWRQIGRASWRERV